MADPVLVAKAAATLLTNEKARKGVGWAIAAILSPIIVLVALLCSLGSGAADHNISAAQLCFQTGPIPADVPAEYRIWVEQMRANFAELDTVIADIQSNMDEGNSLDPIRVKAVFFSLYFGVEAPPVTQFAHCFAASETRTETVTEQDEDGNDVEVERIYNVFVPIEDMLHSPLGFSDRLGHEGTLNCAFFYDENRWREMDPEHTWHGWKCWEIIE